MGMGEIVSGGEGGLYQAKVRYRRDDFNTEIARLEETVVRLNQSMSDKEFEINNLKISLSTLNHEYYQKAKQEIFVQEENLNILKLRALGCTKRIDYLKRYMPNDRVVSVWCADLSEELSGEIGLIEIPGESKYLNIQPGYQEGAVYDQVRDGHLMPTVMMSANQYFFNRAVMPGWQKWKPTYRYGEITSINGELAYVILENIRSSQQDLEINQTDTLKDVIVDYMDCGIGAFEVGDNVLIEFAEQDWNAPIIIGFKDNPKTCFIPSLYIELDGKCIVWDLETNNLSTKVINNDGNIPSFPCEVSAISVWLGKRKNAEQENIIDYHRDDYYPYIDINFQPPAVGTTTYIAPAPNWIQKDITTQNATFQAIDYGYDATGDWGPHRSTKTIASTWFSWNNYLDWQGSTSTEATYTVIPYRDGFPRPLTATQIIECLNNGAIRGRTCATTESSDTAEVYIDGTMTGAYINPTVHQFASPFNDEAEFDIQLGHSYAYTRGSSYGGVPLQYRDNFFYTKLHYIDYYTKGIAGGEANSFMFTYYSEKIKIAEYEINENYILTIKEITAPVSNTVAFLEKSSEDQLPNTLNPFEIQKNETLSNLMTGMMTDYNTMYDIMFDIKFIK